MLHRKHVCRVAMYAHVFNVYVVLLLHATQLASLGSWHPFWSRACRGGSCICCFLLSCLAGFIISVFKLLALVRFIVILADLLAPTAARGHFAPCGCARTGRSAGRTGHLDVTGHTQQSSNTQAGQAAQAASPETQATQHAQGGRSLRANSPYREHDA